MRCLIQNASKPGKCGAPLLHQGSRGSQTLLSSQPCFAGSSGHGVFPEQKGDDFNSRGKLYAFQGGEARLRQRVGAPGCICWGGQGRGIGSAGLADAAVSQAAQRVRAERGGERRWFNGDYPSWKRACAVNKTSGLAGAYRPFSEQGGRCQPSLTLIRARPGCGRQAGGTRGSLRTRAIARCQQN